MPVILIWIGIFLGLFAGILVNYFADVLPVSRRFSQPACTHCGQVMAWSDYLTWHVCKQCGGRRSVRHFVIQIFYIIIFSFLWIHPPVHLGYWLGYVLLIFFGIVVVIDLEHRLVLHQVSIAGMVLGLGIGIYLHGLWQTILGGAVGFGIMLGLYYLGGIYARWLAHRRGQDMDEVALGYGDVNLSGVLGLILGWPGIIAGLVFAILAGGLVSLIYIIALVISRKYKPFTAIPYAPFLIFGATLLLYRF